MAPDEYEGLKPLHVEYGVGGFYRRFTLGEAIDRSNIQAEVRNGVLAIRLPKAAQARPRRIEVQARSREHRACGPDPGPHGKPLVRQSSISTGVPIGTSAARSSTSAFCSEMQPNVQSTLRRLSEGWSVPWMPIAPPTPT